MTSKLFFRSVSACALLAGSALIPAVASAQAPARLDGYCYVRKTDMQRNTTTDSYGVKRAYARCYNGVYYAYSGDAYSAPEAPDGYQVAYYTHRPEADYYQRVVDADTRYASSSRSSTTSTYTGSDGYATTSGSYYDAPTGGHVTYGAASDRTGAGYSYGDNGYVDRRYSDHSDNRAGDDGYARGDDRDYRQSDDRYQADDRDYTSHSAVEGWRDDAGQWHVGRPRAVGWQDDNGRWHVGTVETYGWRDGRGQWHESREDDNAGGYSQDSRYGNY